MKILVSIILLIFLYEIGLTQEDHIVENNVSLFSLKQEKDTVDFIVVDTVLKEQKPVLLWCQGSLPTPLFCEIENYGYYFLGGGVSNFDYKAIAKDYYLVVISMPKTPVLAKKENLNNSYHYIPDPSQPHTFSEAYVKADFLENYVQRANNVLSFLSKQDWVDNKKLVVVGHSQGAKVATKIATSNSSVTHIGLFSPNPLGRIDQYVREARLKAQLGKISWEEADSIINAQYDFLKEIHNKDSLKKYPHYKSWQSFNETFYDDWLALDIPIYLAYGTEDRIADMCDLVPLFFIQNNKDNLTLKRYLGLEHNFFEVSETGRPNRKKKHWGEVMDNFIDWVE